MRTSPAESQNKNVRSLVQSWSLVLVGTNWCLSLYQPFVQGWLTLSLIVNKLWMWGSNLPEWILFFSCVFLNFSLYEGAEFLLERFFSEPDFTGVHLGWVLLTCTWKHVGNFLSKVLCDNDAARHWTRGSTLERKQKNPQNILTNKWEWFVLPWHHHLKQYFLSYIKKNTNSLSNTNPEASQPSDHSFCQKKATAKVTSL